VARSPIEAIIVVLSTKYTPGAMGALTAVAPGTSKVWSLLTLLIVTLNCTAFSGPNASAPAEIHPVTPINDRDAVVQSARSMVITPR
jgi:hypothetical protein